jgi:hypothetical protein
MIVILEYPQKVSLTPRDKIFTLKESPGSNAPVIVVNYFGGILLGHNNDRNKRNYNLDREERIWDYEFYALLSEELLIKIVEYRNIERAVKELCKVVHKSIVEFLLPGDLAVIEKVLACYTEVRLSKKFIYFSNSMYEDLDEIKINNINTLEEAELRIDILFHDESYFGLDFRNCKNGMLFFDVIITSDDKFSAKFRNAFSYDEFVEIASKHFDDEVFEYLNKVWNGELKWAHKGWTSDKFKIDTGFAHGQNYSVWNTQSLK